MKMYCYTCGAANNYSYSSGKPAVCYKCNNSFASVEIKKTEAAQAETLDEKSAREVKAGFQWVRDIKISELFDLQVTQD